MFVWRYTDLMRSGANEKKCGGDIVAVLGPFGDSSQLNVSGYSCSSHKNLILKKKKLLIQIISHAH